ncbi:hypothetical protein ACFVXE_38600 [Streptomyces sp. NPDC058231]|uniref:hypothetical protein n=1 Tax=Streptomyces sp. NPDC058231 TaxID=3346392 RepID=UPI0036E0FDD8
MAVPLLDVVMGTDGGDVGVRARSLGLRAGLSAAAMLPAADRRRTNRPDRRVVRKYLSLDVRPVALDGHRPVLAHTRGTATAWADASRETIDEWCGFADA